ncbi:MAG: hypothetical protein MUO67_16780 [Anaerolineales bacterium]|jgi:hypothetical protein|nr:hypothetical protein [Anaerolineales bacterium]
MQSPFSTTTLNANPLGVDNVDVTGARGGASNISFALIAIDYAIYKNKTAISEVGVFTARLLSRKKHLW